MSPSFNLPKPDHVRHKVHISQATPGWGLVMTSGVGLSCMVNISATELLRSELGVSAEVIEREIETIFLNGRVVDDPATVLVPDEGRLALAAGLPGIAGLAMKKNSPVRALRAGAEADSLAGEPAEAKPGYITLALFSLTLNRLAAHFLRRGVMIETGYFMKLLATAPAGKIIMDDRQLRHDELLEILSNEPQEAQLVLSAELL